VRTLYVMSIALAACDGGGASPDARPPIDAREPNFECADDVFPDPIPDPISYAGEIYEPGLTGSAQDEPVGGASIQAWDLARAQSLAFANAGDDGRFTLELATGGDPLNTFLEARSNLHLTTRTYLPTPVFEPRDDIDIPLFTQQHVDTTNNFAGITPDPSQGILVVRAFDCDAVPLAGVTFTLTPPPLDTLYVAAVGLPSYETKTSSQGAAIMLDIEPGSVRLDADYNGRELRGHTFEVVPTSTAVTTAAIVP